jgi:hypothetical protein
MPVCSQMWELWSEAYKGLKKSTLPEPVILPLRDEHWDICTRIVITAMFTLVENWEQPNYPMRIDLVNYDSSFNEILCNMPVMHSKTILGHGQMQLYKIYTYRYVCLKC